MGVPCRKIREDFLIPGILKGMKLGGNCWRVSKAEFRRFVERGVTGCNHLPASGQWKKERGCGMSAERHRAAHRPTERRRTSINPQGKSTYFF